MKVSTDLRHDLLSIVQGLEMSNEVLQMMTSDTEVKKVLELQEMAHLKLNDLLESLFKELDS